MSPSLDRLKSAGSRPGPRQRHEPGSHCGGAAHHRRRHDRRPWSARAVRLWSTRRAGARGGRPGRYARPRRVRHAGRGAPPPPRRAARMDTAASAGRICPFGERPMHGFGRFRSRWRRGRGGPGRPWNPSAGRLTPANSTTNAAFCRLTTD